MPEEKQAAKPEGTAEARWDRAREILLSLNSQEAHDILLIMALGAPTLLIQVLAEAGATVMEVPVAPQAEIPGSKLIN